MSEQTRLSIPGCKRGSPGATEHHTAVSWNDAAPQESVEFLDNGATTSQFMLLIVVDTPPCVNTDTLKPGIQVKSVFVHSDNAHWSGLAFEAVITKAGPLALRTMARLPKSVRWRVPALQTLNFNEKTPRERTQSGILCGKEKSEISGSSALRSHHPSSQRHKQSGRFCPLFLTILVFL